MTTCRRCAELTELTRAQQVLAHAMSEAELQANVRDAARKLSWLAYHTRFSVLSDRGFPDLVLVGGDDEIFFVEVKAQHGKLTPHQLEWADAIHEVEQATEGRVMYFCWRPSHWLSGMIEEALSKP